MFGKKIYPAPGENLASQVAFKNMGGKITEFMLKWVYISYPNIRLKCTECSKVFTLRQKSIFPWLRVTSFMLLSLLDRLRSSSFKKLANLSDVSPTTLRKYARVLLKNELDWKVCLFDKFLSFVVLKNN